MTYQGVDPRDGRRRRDRGPMSPCDPSPVMRSLYISIVVAVFAGCPAAQHQPPRPPVRVAREPIIPGPVAPTAPPAAAPSQAAADTPTAAASTALITLPLLDAMFADPGFASEIKARLGLSDEQIEGFADYYAAQKPAPSKSTHSKLEAEGKAIYDKGLPAKGVLPCKQCHGDNAEGASGFPRLAGLSSKYVYSQLQAFRTPLRPHGVLMKNETRALSQAQLKAVSAYVQSR